MEHIIRRRGFGLIDVLLAIGASSLVYVGMAQIQNDQRQNQSAITTAHQLQMISSAAKTYIKKNYTKLLTVIPNNNVVEVPLIGNPNWNGLGDVQYGGGLISSNFEPSLPNGQEAHLLIRHIPAVGNIPEHLESMLVTTGSAMNDRQVGVTMNAMEGSGGGMMQRPPLGTPGNVIQGAFGSWSQPIGSWASAGVPLTSGHVAYALESLGAPISDYLNRYNTGDPEANRLHTHIDFNGNNADNVNNLDVQTINNTRADSITLNSAFNGNANLRITGVQGTVNFKSGLNLCNNNTNGCGISISADGGLYDYNDGWITLTNAYNATGLHLSGSNNGSGNLLADGYGKFNGNLSSRGYDPNNGLPSGVAGGLHTADVYAEGSLIAGRGGQVSSVINSDGNGYVTNTFTASQLVANNTVESRNKIFVDNAGCNISVAGVSYCGDYGNAWLSIPGNGYFVVGHQDGSRANTYTGNLDVTGQANISGNVRGQDATLSTVAVSAIATPGEYCSPNGKIASHSDGSGNILSCVNGTWSTVGANPFSTLYQNAFDMHGTSGFNTTGKTLLMTATTGCSSQVTAGSVTYSLGNGGGSLTVVIPPGAGWSIYLDESEGCWGVQRTMYQ